ncbi:MAG: hypothetical protein JST76_06290 [Bacteroidetes bacterium]|nr:hypothetical protein [Bacteroidota bacterium]
MKTILLALLLICMASDTFAQAFPSEKDIYDFMQMVVKDQKLFKGLYLDSSPALDCSTIDDSSYLYTLDASLVPLREADKKIHDTCMVRLWGNSDIALKRFSFTLGAVIPSVLSKDDIAYMLAQRAHLTAFKWNGTRLGFNKTATYNYYYISAPVFSVDKAKAILKIEELCPGLCGQGHTILYTKKDGTWTAEIGATWYH